MGSSSPLPSISPCLQPPILPLEVIEKVIDFCAGDAHTLCSLALTCRQLRHRSAFVLFNHVLLRSKHQCIKFQETIQALPDLQPVVESLSYAWIDSSSFPFLSILSRLRRLTIHNGPHRLTIHSTFPLESQCFRATNLQDLSIKNVTFNSQTAFFCFLSAFTSIANFTCERVNVPGVVGDFTSEPVQLQLKTLNILMEVYALDALFIASQLIHSPLETQSCWPISLTWWIPLSSHLIQDAVGRLRRMKPAAIRDLTLVFSERHVPLMYFKLRLDDPDDILRLLVELDETLIAYPTHHVSFTVDQPLSVRKTISWEEEIGRSLHPMQFSWSFQDFRYSSRCGHDNAINALAISLDGRWVATCADDRTIILWDARTGCISQEWIVEENVKVLAFSPDGQRLVSSNLRKMSIWGTSGGVRLISTIQRQQGTCLSLSWSSNGSYLASEYAINNFRYMQVWRVEGDTLNTLSLNDGTFAKMALFSPDSHLLLTRVSSQDTYLWNPVSHAYDLLHVPTLHQHDDIALDDDTYDDDDDFYTAAFSHSSRQLALSYGNGYIHIWTIASKTMVCLRTQYPSHCIAFSPDDRQLLSVSRNMMMIWDALTGTSIRPFNGPVGGVYDACFSPCGTYIASVSKDKTVKLWRVSDGSCLATLSDHDAPVEHIAFTPDGAMLWSGAQNGSVLSYRVHDILAITLDLEA